MSQVITNRIRISRRSLLKGLTAAGAPMSIALLATEVNEASAEQGLSLPMMSTRVMHPCTVPPHDADPATVASEQNVCVASQAAWDVSVVGAASRVVVAGPTL